MEKKLTLEEIDERNSKVRLPKKDGKLDYEKLAEIMDGVFITREDGSEVSLANAVYADIEWLHHSQKRAADRAMQGLVDLETEAAIAVIREELSPEDFIKIFGCTQ
jgi:hypothetical protein